MSTGTGSGDRSPFRGRSFAPPAERAVDEELAFHIAERRDELIAEGWSPQAAQEEVERRFGSQREVRDECLELTGATERRARRRDVFWSWLGEFRGALRGLRRTPAWTAVVVVTLAVGLAALLVTSTLVEQVLLRPLPFEDSGDLALLWQNDRVTGTTREATSIPDFRDWQQRLWSFDQLAAYSTFEGTALDEEQPRRVRLARVTPNLLDALGRSVVNGRLFTEDDLGAEAGPAVVMVSESYWKRLTGLRSSRDEGAPLADAPSDLRTVRLDGQVFDVVGVYPDGLEVPGADVDAWLPLDTSGGQRARHGTMAVGRRRPDVSWTVADGELARISADLEEEYPDSNRGRGSFVEPLQEALRGGSRTQLWLLFGAGLLVLVVVVVNVGSLAVTKALGLRQELALRGALGSSRARLLGRFLFEAMLLSGAAVAAAGVVAALALARLRGSLVSELLAVDELVVGPRAISVCAVAALGVVAVLTLLPWWRQLGGAGAVSLDVARSGARAVGAANRRGRALLAVVQVALAVPLLAGAALLVMSLDRLDEVDPGFNTEGVVRASFQLPRSRYPRSFSNYPNWDEVNAFNSQVLEGAAALPGVDSAALVTAHPLDPGGTNSFVIVGREQESLEYGEIRVRIVTPGYFATSELKLLEGRAFEAGDATDREAVAVLGGEAARRLFPDGGALGERLAFWGIERRIVGVAADERIFGVDGELPFAVYVNLLQAPQVSTATLLVRSDRSLEALAAELRGVVGEVDPQVALFDFATMDHTLLASQARRRVVGSLLLVLALITAALATLGVFSILASLQAERRTELGLRLAIGAGPAQLRREVLGFGLRLGAAGSALGLFLHVMTAGRLAPLLFGVDAHSPVVLLGCVALAVGLSGLASWWPALRASRVDPVRALNS